MSAAPTPNCPDCQGSGWIIVERPRHQDSGARRCDCVTRQWKKRGPAGPKPTLLEALAATEALSELIPFFPQDAGAKKLIAVAVQGFAESKEALDWFTQAAATRLTKWEGIAMLRALYATSYELKDGEPPTFTDRDGRVRILYFPGSSPEELERQAQQREMEDNQRKLEDYRRQALGLPESERFLLPEVKRIQ